MPTAEAAPGENLSPALSLVNTRIDGPRGTVELVTDADGLAGWLRRVFAAGRMDANPHDLPRVFELRSAIRTLFSSTATNDQPDAAATNVVNGAAAADPGAPQLTSNSVIWSGTESNDATVALAAVARDAIVVLASGTPIRECAAPDCNRMFIPDHGRRIWCSATCGNRVRASRHHARHGRMPASASAR